MNKARKTNVLGGEKNMEEGVGGLYSWANGRTTAETRDFGTGDGRWVRLEKCGRASPIAEMCFKLKKN